MYMLTLFHGDNTEKSRDELNRLRNLHTGKDIRVLNGSTIDEAKLRQAIESYSLFSVPTLIICEKVCTVLAKQTVLLKKILSVAVENAKESEIIFWEPRELGKTVLNLFGIAQIRYFPFPKILFTFLDSMRPDNTKEILRLWHELLEHEAPELATYMIVSRIRQLIQAKDNVYPERSSSWQAGRLTNQAKFFTMEQLIRMHKSLLENEYSLKTGTTPFNARQLSEQWIISYL